MGYSFARRGCRESRIPLIADMDEYRIPISVVDPKSTREVDAEKPPRLDPGDFEPGTSKPRELWKLRSGTWSRHRRSFVFWIDFFIRRDEPSERVAADMSQLLRPPTTDEQVARALASHYGEHPNLKNDDAFAWCLGNGFPELSERGFYERVLPEARRIAELPVRGRSGPKKLPR